jgi:ADP-ribosylation factor-binding protein GGA
LFHLLTSDLCPPGDILQASDDLSRVINSYKKIVKGQTVNGDIEDARSAAGEGE